MFTCADCVYFDQCVELDLLDDYFGPCADFEWIGP